MDREASAELRGGTMAKFGVGDRVRVREDAQGPARHWRGEEGVISDDTAGRREGRSPPEVLYRVQLNGRDDFVLISESSLATAT